MGKGKGNVEYWVAKIQPGKMLYEMEGVTEEVAREAFAPRRGQAPDPDHLRDEDGGMSRASGTVDLREKSVEELDGELTSLYREKFNLRMQQGSGQDVKPHDHKRVRREIARVKDDHQREAVHGCLR